MFPHFEERRSDSPFVERIWMTQSERARSFTSISTVLWSMVISKWRGHITISLHGPETGATRKEFPGVQSFAGQAELHSFLAASSVLVCLLPSTPATRGLLDHANLSRLPRGAHVVNVARGKIIVDEDLVALLDEGHLASATLDVFRVEPLPAGHPFWHHPRITLTPHISAVTMIDDSIAQVAAKIRRLERGETVTGIVDRARGY